MGQPIPDPAWSLVLVHIDLRRQIRPVTITYLLGLMCPPSYPITVSSWKFSSPLYPPIACFHPTYGLSSYSMFLLTHQHVQEDSMFPASILSTYVARTYLTSAMEQPIPAEHVFCWWSSALRLVYPSNFKLVWYVMSKKLISQVMINILQNI